MTPHLVAEKNNAFPVIIEYAYFWMEQEQGKEVYDLLNTFTERGHKIRIEAQEKRQNTKGTKMKKMQRDRYMLEECDFSKGIRGKYATKAMTVITTIFVLCLFAGPAAAEEDCPLKGKWKSNEKATLEQMNKYGNVSEKQRKTFTENNVFGKQFCEATCTDVTLYFEGDPDKTNYKIKKRDGNNIEVQGYDDVTKETWTRKIKLKGDCFHLSLEPISFSEVFCRVK